MRPKRLPKHGQRKNRQRKRRADPQPFPHQLVFRIRLLVGYKIHRLERHPALRTCSGTNLEDLGVHRAGVTGLRGRRVCRTIRGGVAFDPGSARREQKSLRLAFKCPGAARRAEEVSFSFVVELTRRASRIHHHSAYGVFFLRRSTKDRKRGAAGSRLWQNFRHGSCCVFDGGGRENVPYWTLSKALRAASAAEVVGLSTVLDLDLGRFPLHLHPAYRIEFHNLLLASGLRRLLVRFSISGANKSVPTARRTWLPLLSAFRPRAPLRRSVSDDSSSGSEQRPATLPAPRRSAR